MCNTTIEISHISMFKVKFCGSNILIFGDVNNAIYIQYIRYYFVNMGYIYTIVYFVS